MLSDSLSELIKLEDEKFSGRSRSDFIIPEYNPEKHYLDVARSGYFRAICVLRHFIEATSDHYFTVVHGAKKADLYMITSSLSSPAGPGSDSVAIPLNFGKGEAYLTDSAQFGLEPILMNGFEKLYCYMPSLRGDDCDERHLNQFYHCEAEIKGKIGDIILLVENYIKILCQALLVASNTVYLLSQDSDVSKKSFDLILRSDGFPTITFDRAADALIENGKGEYVIASKYGRTISWQGEIEIAKIFNFDIPFWLTNFDRDIVPFYQKPSAQNKDKVINADLLFPQLVPGSFGGEVAGCGQRQDSEQEIIESLKRQDLSKVPYEWYIDLRRQPDYQVTSGFGMGVERFLTWALCRGDIKDVIIYPRIKNLFSTP